jgi:hypothetical protein
VQESFSQNSGANRKRDDAPRKTDEGAIYPRKMDHGKTGWLVAQNIRHERTGLHAFMAVLLDDIPLESDNFNIERSEERNRLARRTYEQIVGIKADDITPSIWTREAIAHDLFRFSMWLQRNYDQLQNEVVQDELDPIPGIDWLIKPYLFGSGATTLFAPPTSGKSTVAMAMAISLSTGSNHLWEVEHTVPTLWVNLERPPDAVKLRARQLAAAVGIPGPYGVSFLHRRGQTLPNVSAGIDHWVKSNPGGYVFLDSISRTGLGKLVDDATANQFTDTMHGVAPSGWLGIGHTSKADNNQMYGNIMFSAGADVELRLRSQAKETELGVKVEIATSNHTGKQDSMTLAFEYQGDALINVRKADEGEFTEIIAVASSNMSQVDRITEALRELGPQTATQIADATKIHVSDTSKLLRKAAGSAKGEFVFVGDPKDKVYGLASDRDELKGY